MVRLRGAHGRRRSAVLPALRSDAGFSLLEVIICLVVMGTIMTALTSFFTMSTGTVHRNGIKQVAIQVALDGMERARGLRGAALLSGRALCGTCPDPATTGAGAAVADMQRWDAAGTAGTAQSLPPGGDTVTLGGITFHRYWYVGKCWQPVGGGACGADATKPVPLIRVVVAVTWPDRACAANLCSHVTSGLFSAVTEEPLFRADPPPVPPAAIWANRLVGGSGPGLDIQASWVTITGPVHSNSDVSVQSTLLTVSQAPEYLTSQSVVGSVYKGPAPIKVASSTAPPSRSVPDYRPGGSAATGAGYHQVTSCKGGNWDFSAAEVAGASVIYVPCAVSISKKLLVVNALIVAEGTITIGSSDVTVGDQANPSATGLVSNASGPAAINVGGSRTQVYGNIQALNGQITFTGSDITATCGVMGDTVKLGSDGITISVDDTCIG